MNEFSEKNQYGFDIDEDSEWFLVHSGAVTNTNPGSVVYVDIDTTPICPNMTDKEFRVMARRLLGWAAQAVDRRISDLNINDHKTKERMEFWFGVSDETTRQYLLVGFRRVSGVIKSLAPTNLVRANPETDKILGCAPNLKNLDGEAAHVCAPNTDRRLISISKKFCSGLRDEDEDHDSRVSTIIHEATHFIDTFASGDSMYTISTPLAMWGQRNSELALRNADSLAGYVLYGEKRYGYSD
ncbi:M35 family metallo-endopeptidase [Burkholderia stagnalis]|uniref:Peptidase M35 n=1 Tax=Burkholderia stagnalis TaxID=1503054 RepID=A0ABX9YSU9_9BURK|nr:M35 family metallo-endopeptidase [Burkholderia stagnalis]MDY7803748.1 M35 family metallo-endopeptidase [Burkholderia stagnalis]RQQ62988.1 peptidase M35 [Burkholderia stagnalis]RQQ72671.1 peptidase M35 [Burkholderia stagnalis]RQQ74957.1 peptidase M35 [Burkholderia stagnalis]RQQ86418.1 peptidase M35 [Burkholderia stagnalis]